MADQGMIPHNGLSLGVRKAPGVFRTRNLQTLPGKGKRKEQRVRELWVRNR